MPDELNAASTDATPEESAAGEESPAAEEPPVEQELLKTAVDEEQDIQRVRKTIRDKDSFIIFCPQGCRIRVKDRHRGKNRKMPSLRL